MNRGTLRKRGNSWEIRAYLGKHPGTGKDRYTSKTVKGSQIEAEKRLTELLAKVDQERIPIEKLTVAAFSQRWLAIYARPKVKASTYRRYEECLRVHVVPAIGSMQLAAVKPLDLQQLYADLSNRYAANTVKNVHIVLHQMFKHAWQSEIVLRNVADMVDPPRGAKFEPRVPSPEQVLRVLEAAEGMFIEPLVQVWLLLPDYGRVSSVGFAGRMSISRSPRPALSSDKSGKSSLVDHLSSLLPSRNRAAVQCSLLSTP
jgi:hypothetical protein